MLAVALTQWKRNGFGQSISPRRTATLKVQDRYGLAVSTMFLNYLAARDTHTPLCQHPCISLTEAAGVLSLPKADSLDISLLGLFLYK